LGSSLTGHASSGRSSPSPAVSTTARSPASRRCASPDLVLACHLADWAWLRRTRGSGASLRAGYHRLAAKIDARERFRRRKPSSTSSVWSRYAFNSTRSETRPARAPRAITLELRREGEQRRLFPPTAEKHDADRQSRGRHVKGMEIAG
jgi:hypothetical protein